MEYRKARLDDLPVIIQLYGDDNIGSTREILAEPIDDIYIRAFEDIAKDRNNQIYVIEDQGKVIGTLQYTIITHLNRTAAKRAQIESVHIHRDYRNKGIGKKFMQFAIDLAKSDGCKIVQLTSDKTRQDAQRFYQDLGFTDSHVGMKKYI